MKIRHIKLPLIIITFALQAPLHSMDAPCAPRRTVAQEEKISALVQSSELEHHAIDEKMFANIMNTVIQITGNRSTWQPPAINAITLQEIKEIYEQMPAQKRSWFALLSHAALTGNVPVMAPEKSSRYLMSRKVAVKLIKQYVTDCYYPDGQQERLIATLPLLTVAALYGHTAATKYFCEHGTSSQAKRRYTDSILMRDKIDDNLQDTGLNPLHYAAMAGQAETVGILLAHGASIDKIDGSSWTALHHAAKRGHTETVQLLLEKSAEVDKTDGCGCTALLLATAYGHEKVKEMLLGHGADQEVLTSEHAYQGCKVVHAKKPDTTPSLQGGIW